MASRYQVRMPYNMMSTNISPMQWEIVKSSSMSTGLWAFSQRAPAPEQSKHILFFFSVLYSSCDVLELQANLTNQVYIWGLCSGTCPSQSSRLIQEWNNRHPGTTLVTCAFVSSNLLESQTHRHIVQKARRNFLSEGHVLIGGCNEAVWNVRQEKQDASSSGRGVSCKENHQSFGTVLKYWLEIATKKEVFVLVIKIKEKKPFNRRKEKNRPAKHGKFLAKQNVVHFLPLSKKVETRKQNMIVATPYKRSIKKIKNPSLNWNTAPFFSWNTLV